MLWEVRTNDFNQIKIDDEKIAETFHGWHIINVIYPDREKASEIDYLTITIKRDNNEEN